jgi:two-component system sensor histidine kinase CpxA
MRLVPKIFLWFWLGIVVISGTLMALTELTHSRAKDDEHWRERYGPRVDLWARQETQILDRQGTEALRKYVASFESDPGVRNYIFDATGHEVLEREVPQHVRQVVSLMEHASSTEQRLLTQDRIVAEKIVRGGDQEYVVIVSFPQPSLLRAPLVDFLVEDLGTEALVRFSALLAVAAAFSFWLARQITSPIDRLRAAAREIANAHLEARVDKAIIARGDELADLGGDFDRMAERIDTLVSAQRRLLSDVSHTLRSPLARLNVALGLARQHANPEVVGHLDRIERETEGLNKLIGQLLTMARVESGVDRERQRLFDLGTLVEEVAADGDYEARSRQCVVQVRQPVECVVEGAREMLRTAVENVVRNAVHHTTDGTRVEIAMGCRDSGNGPRAVIEVRDHGTGVPEDALGDLFTPFHQVVDGVHQQRDSTGLGLAITERAFRLHGGTVAAANAVGGGLVVTLELPMVGGVREARASTIEGRSVPDRAEG